MLHPLNTFAVEAEYKVFVNVVQLTVAIFNEVNWLVPVESYLRVNCFVLKLV